MRWCSNDRPQRPLLSPKDRLPDPQDRLDDRRSCPRRKRQRARRERRRESQRAHDTEQLALPEPHPNNKVPKDSLQSRRASVSPQRVSWPTLVGPTLGEFHASASPSKGMRSLPTSCASHQRIAAQHRHPVTRRKPGDTEAVWTRVRRVASAMARFTSSGCMGRRRRGLSSFPATTLSSSAPAISAARSIGELGRTRRCLGNQLIFPAMRRAPRTNQTRFRS
jgi:hypothetical protein